jgi:hypothetical protein
MMPSVIIDADNDAAFCESSLVIVAECKERKVSPVPRVISIDVDHVRIWFTDKNRLLLEV